METDMHFFTVALPTSEMQFVICRTYPARILRTEFTITKLSSFIQPHAFDYAILKEEWMPTIIETWYDEMEPAWGFTIQLFELLPPNRPPKKRESFNKH